MLVPEFWAEARTRERKPAGQVTVRRFGWSMTSEGEARAMAEQRVADALARISGGEALPTREPKVPYNGAEGVPIREEVVRRYGDDVVTRNSYGARCLNTPDVWIADVDFEKGPPVGAIAATLASLAVATWLVLHLPGSIGLQVAAGVMVLLSIVCLERARRVLFVPAEVRARRRIAKFVARRPDWRLRVHRTPNGLRLVALHATIEPTDPDCARAFNELGVDRLYAQMSLRQRCYRARLDAKPWRIGIATHLKPRPGVWPVAPEKRELRTQWLAQYEPKARGYAACRFEDEIGGGLTNERALRVSSLHDELAGALTDRPIA